MTTKTVTLTSLQRRINRALTHDGLVLRKCREGSRYYHERGDYYIVDVQTRGINETHVDLEDLARELNVLKDSESLTEPEIESEAPKVRMSEKEFIAKSRQMQKEIRLIMRRREGLLKKKKRDGLTHEEQAELENLFGETSRKATDDLCRLLLSAG